MPDLENHLVCPHCNWEWAPRLPNPPGPAQCPRCTYRQHRCPGGEWPTTDSPNNILEEVAE